MMKYGLIGAKLSHSFSKPIHNKLGAYDYELCELSSEELALFMTKREFCAINVTIPYKKDVIPYLCELSEEAKKIGSVNTIVNKNGKLYGYNTDYYGFFYMANLAGISFSGKKVMILGTGGTSLTAAAVAKDKGASEIVLVSRNGAVNYENLYEKGHSDCDILINTTPVGMYPNNGQTLLSLSRFPQLSGVIDVIYNPLYTELLLAAKQRGIPHTNGLPMLVAQAKYASELFFDTTIPDSRISEITAKMKKDVSNIVLVGMPGSGKTSIGKEVAKLLSREFVDTDAFIEEKAGVTVPELFAKYGEAHFRELETEIIVQIGKQKGLVIATGGGAILKEENRNALIQNGFVFFIERDISLLDRKNRPLSQGSDALFKLYETRLPIYQSISSAVLQIKEDIDSTVSTENNVSIVNNARRLIEAFSAL